MRSIENLKKALICKHVKNYRVSSYLNKKHIPKAGDVAIFKVLDIGKHKAIQNSEGKNSYIFPGDYIMATFGNRYATNQFEGYVPKKIHNQYQILGQGGCIGVLKSTHAKFDLIGATQLKLVGYAVHKSGKIINTKYLNEQEEKFRPNNYIKPQIILSVGSSMDSGKTTSAAYLCRGLKNAGKKVAFVKLTGTVFSKDKRFVKDCGAHIAVDFSNIGFPSTYMCSLSELLNLYQKLLSKVSKINPDYIVMEIADGLLQRETNLLLNHKPFTQTIDHIMLSCGDSLGVLSGLNYLNEIEFKPFGICGLINASPLLVDEVTKTIDIPVFNLSDLMSKSIIEKIKTYNLKKEIA